MTTSEEPEALVASADWMLTTALYEEQAVLMLLFDMDVQSAQIALERYVAGSIVLQAASPVGGVDRRAHGETLNAAKEFVVAMRRVGRLLESLAANRTQFPGPLGRTIRTIWRKRRVDFQQFIAPRNAIEHIDGEVKGKTSWRMVNVVDDTLEVTPKASAPVTREALGLALSSRQELVEAFREYLPTARP